MMPGRMRSFRPSRARRLRRISSRTGSTRYPETLSSPSVRDVSELFTSHPSHESSRDYTRRPARETTNESGGPCGARALPRPALLRCPRTPSAGSTPLGVGLLTALPPPVRCSRAAARCALPEDCDGRGRRPRPAGPPHALFEPVESRPQAVVGLEEVLRHHAHLGDRGHEVRVARPARHDVPVEVIDDARAGRGPEVHADVESVGAE